MGMAATLSAVKFCFILGVIFCLWPKAKSCYPEETECSKDSPLNPPGCLWVVGFVPFFIVWIGIFEEYIILLKF